MSETTIPAADAQASLEAALKGEILRMYEEVAEKPDGSFHFFHGREAAELFEYDPELLDRAPSGAVASFAGVGNPHLRSELQPGETNLDLGSGAGLDGIIAAEHRQRPQALGVLNRRRSPGGRVVRADGAGGLQACEVGGRSSIPLQAAVDPELSRGVWREGRAHDGSQARVGNPRHHDPT
jgi:hypothetical protein